MTHTLPLRLLCLLSLFALAAAYGAEYFLDAIPCKLCLMERIPYIALVIATLPAWMTLETGILKRLSLLCIFLLMVEVGLSVYHVGVEQHWWGMSEICHSQTILIHPSIDDLLADIMAQETPPCNEIGFAFLGVSMATWNLILSFGLLGWVVYYSMALYRKATT